MPKASTKKSSVKKGKKKQSAIEKVEKVQTDGNVENELGVLEETLREEKSKLEKLNMEKLTVESILKNRDLFPVIYDYVLKTKREI